MKVNHIPALLLLLLLPVFDSGYCVQDPFIKMKLGGVRDYIGAQNSLEIDALARFAVQEHNKKQVFSFVFFGFSALYSLISGFVSLPDFLSYFCSQSTHLLI